MDYKHIIKEYEENLISDLRELVSIRSVQGDAAGDHPFGDSIQEAAELMLSYGKKYGFETENFQNYGAHIEWGQGDEILGIPVHLDVVSEGDDWLHDPYEAVIEQGRMYGRGTSDNKGPAMAILYAMRTLKAAGFTPNKRIRLILGLDEETSWIGMKYYLEKAGCPDFGFTPDGNFPCVRAEKGALVFEIAKKLSRPVLGANGIVFKSITGGRAYNMVPDEATLLLTADDYAELKQSVSDYKKSTGHSLSYRVRGKSMEIKAEGIAAHGASPERGKNAISVLMDFCKGICFTEEDVNDAIDFYNKHIGFCTDGSAIGCGFSDEESGRLAFNVGLIDMSKEAMRLTVNVRFPFVTTEDAVYDAMMPYLDRYGMGIVKRDYKPPVYFSEDDPYLKRLTDVYRSCTGDCDSSPIIMSGASYARAFPMCVCFGLLRPGDEDVMHKHDEYIDLENLFSSVNIYARTIEELTK